MIAISTMDLCEGGGQDITGRKPHPLHYVQHCRPAILLRHPPSTNSHYNGHRRASLLRSAGLPPSLSPATLLLLT